MNMLKKILLGLVIVVAVGFIFRENLYQILVDQVTKDMFVAEDTDNFDPGPAVGAEFPTIKALYQGEEVSSISEFAGSNGTIFIASRSLDWCPFCMKQMIQLQQYKQDFDAAGIGMVGITYDAPELQQVFIDEFNITIPILSDIKTSTFTSLGILNQDYQPGDSAYGIPDPGMIVVDADGRIAGKLFIEAYSARVDSAAALAFAKQALGIE